MLWSKSPHYWWSAVRGGKCSSSTTAYLEPVLNHPNLDVVITTRVTKLIPSFANNTTGNSIPEFNTVQIAQSATGMWSFQSTFHLSYFVSRQNLPSQGSKGGYFVWWIDWHSSDPPFIWYWTWKRSWKAWHPIHCESAWCWYVISDFKYVTWIAILGQHLTDHPLFANYF